MAPSRALIFLGPPGAGKGTQAKLAAQKYGLAHLSTGDMFRDAIRRGTPLGKKVQPILASGALVPDELVMGMVEERLTQSDCARGFIFDGFPRTLPQAAQLDALLDAKGYGNPLVIEFCVSPEKLLRRLAGRWSCPLCGTIYNEFNAPPKIAGVCDRDGAALAQRPDDRFEVVKDRLAAYERQTLPLSDYYRRRGVLEVIDAGQAVEEVGRQLDSVLRCADGADGRL
ncbi:MAG: adenylate kinase [Acidobacteriota bacterium]|nr:adenylate kinase [Acidobacteriota bacterium]MDE3170730.1 adenylate kinase [Acidobacteriota bacterium]